MNFNKKKCAVCNSPLNNKDIIRLNKELKIKLTQKDIVSRPSRAYWTDFEDVLSYNLQPPLYNPELFVPFYVGKDLITKADEFSSPSLKISNFKLQLILKKLLSNIELCF